VTTPTEPICGNCGKPLSHHDAQRRRGVERVYCFLDTHDEFSDEPDPDDIVTILEEHWPDVYAAAVKRWRVENGHEPGG